MTRSISQGWRGIAAGLALLMTPAADPVLAQEPAPLATPDGRTLEVSVGKGRLVRLDRAADAVMIADPTVANVEIISPGLAYIFGVAVGRTNFFAIDGSDQVILASELRVTADAAGATAESRLALGPGAPEIDYLGDRARMDGSVGTVGDAMTASTLATELDGDGQPLNLATYDGSNQINIRVRFAEVSRSEITRLGINWQALASFGDVALGLTTGAFLGEGGPVIGDSFGTIVGGISGSDVSVDLLLDALQREGVVNVLAEPNLTTVSGTTASFLAGGEFPYPVPQSNDFVTFEFKEFGIALDFTPTILPNERIAIEVEPEVSTLNSANSIVVDGYQIPALTVRRADATVELASGQTFAIAGLFQRNLTEGLEQLPLLGDIPILGQLFQSRRFQREETELLILITPYLVTPAAESELALAGQAPTGGLPPLSVLPPSLTGGAAGFLLE